MTRPATKLGGRKSAAAGRWSRTARPGDGGGRRGRWRGAVVRPSLATAAVRCNARLQNAATFSLVETSRKRPVMTHVLGAAGGLSLSLSLSVSLGLSRSLGAVSTPKSIVSKIIKEEEEKERKRERD